MSCHGGVGAQKVRGRDGVQGRSWPLPETNQQLRLLSADADIRPPHTQGAPERRGPGAMSAAW